MSTLNPERELHRASGSLLGADRERPHHFVLRRRGEPALNLVRQKRPQIQILPMLQNLDDEKWQSDVLARAVADEGSRQRLIASLTQFVEQNKFAGICVDFEEPPKEIQANLLRFMRVRAALRRLRISLRTSLAATGMLVPGP